MQDIEAFRENFVDKLFDDSGTFEKDYLKILVDEIVLKGNEVIIKGSQRSLAGMVTMGTKKKDPISSEKVIGSSKVWRPLADALRTFSSD